MVTQNCIDSEIPINVASGGLGVTTLSANGLLIGQGTFPVTTTGTGSAAQVLKSNGPGIDPSFQNADTSPFVDQTSWTPTIRGTTIAGVGTYTKQDGLYVRIGPIVVASFNIAWTAHTGTGFMTIVTLPVTSSATTQRYVGAVETSLIDYALDRFVVSSLDSGSATINLTECKKNSASVFLTMDAAGQIAGTLVYFA